MTKPPSPFAGVKLSDLVIKSSQGPLDQQLFRPAPTPAPSSSPAQLEVPQRPKDVKTPKRHDTQTSLRQDAKTTFGQDNIASRRQEGNTASRKDVNVSRQQAINSYDINEETFERETVRVSKGEQRAIEWLKLSLRDMLDSTVGKNDIFRVGLHFLLEDFHKNGEQSEIVSRLQKKIT